MRNQLSTVKVLKLGTCEITAEIVLEFEESALTYIRIGLKMQAEWLTVQRLQTLITLNYAGPGSAVSSI